MGVGFDRFGSFIETLSVAWCLGRKGKLHSLLGEGITELIFNVTTGFMVAAGYGSFGIVRVCNKLYETGNRSMDT